MYYSNIDLGSEGERGARDTDIHLNSRAVTNQCEYWLDTAKPQNSKTTARKL